MKRLKNKRKDSGCCFKLQERWRYLKHGAENKYQLVDLLLLLFPSEKKSEFGTVPEKKIYLVDLTPSVMWTANKCMW